MLDVKKLNSQPRQKRLKAFKEEWSRIEGEIHSLKTRLRKLKGDWKRQECSLKKGQKVKLFRLDKKREHRPYKVVYFDYIKGVRRDGTFIFAFRDVLKDGSPGKRIRFYGFSKLEVIDGSTRSLP